MLLAAGQQIGTHTWNHVRLAAAAGSPAGVIEREIREISQARDYQVKLTGHDSRLFRFPHDTPDQAWGEKTGRRGHAVGARQRRAR